MFNVLSIVLRCTGMYDYFADGWPRAKAILEYPDFRKMEQSYLYMHIWANGIGEVV